MRRIIYLRTDAGVIHTDRSCPGWDMGYGSLNQSTALDEDPDHADCKIDYDFTLRATFDSLRTPGRRRVSEVSAWCLACNGLLSECRLCLEERKALFKKIVGITYLRSLLGDPIPSQRSIAYKAFDWDGPNFKAAAEGTESERFRAVCYKATH